jgi:hypothetical protein
MRESVSPDCTAYVDVPPQSPPPAGAGDAVALADGLALGAGVSVGLADGLALATAALEPPKIGAIRLITGPERTAMTTATTAMARSRPQIGRVA